MDTSDTEDIESFLGADEGEHADKMTSCRLTKILTVAVEISLWLLMSTVTILLSYNLIGLGPVRRGFLCDDQTIRYMYKDDTVSDTLVAILFILLPIVIMIILETIHVLRSKVRESKEGKHFCHKLMINLYRTIGAFLFSAMCTMFLTETMKLLCGRLRPHFMALCKPNLAALNCSQGYIYISDDLCTSNADDKQLIDSRKSFPSGHASLAVFGAIYLLIYLQKRFTWTKHIRTLLPSLQIGIVFVAIFVCISRVNDNKHHVGDVIGGAILGLVTSYILIKYVSCLGRQTMVETYDLPSTYENSSQMLRTISCPSVRTETNDVNRL